MAAVALPSQANDRRSRRLRRLSLHCRAAHTNNVYL